MPLRHLHGFARPVLTCRTQVGAHTGSYVPQYDGIQVDGSFHQHGAQLYSGWGYGQSIDAL